MVMILLGDSLLFEGPSKQNRKDKYGACMIRKNDSPSVKKKKVFPIFLRRIMYKVRHDNAYSPLPFKKNSVEYHKSEFEFRHENR